MFPGDIECRRLKTQCKNIIVHTRKSFTSSQKLSETYRQIQNHVEDGDGDGVGTSSSSNQSLGMFNLLFACSVEAEELSKRLVR